MRRKRKPAQAKRTPTKDAFQNPLSRMGLFMPNPLETTEYPLTRFTRDGQTINSLYRSHWVVRRIIDVIPEDMMKNGYQVISHMQNYYDTIEEKQEAELRPVYDKLLPILFMSTLGAIPDDLDFEFKPVRRPPEEEMADLASKNTDSVTKAFQAGLISQKTALKELRQQSELTGMWSNITDEDIEKADDEVMNADEGMGGMGGFFGGGGTSVPQKAAERPQTRS